MMGSILRLGLTAAVVVGAAFGAAVGVALIDLYLTGHGHGSITREVISRPSWGVHLSVGDLIMLTAAVAAGAATWKLSRQAL